MQQLRRKCRPERGGQRRGAERAAPAGDTSKGTAKIAIELPLQGSEKAASEPIINGIRLAIKQAGGAAGGYTIEVPDSSIFDDALNGAHDPQTGAANMTKIVSDPDTIAVIGPLNSSVAKAQIPISNEGGLLQCSPANTNPDLTKGAPAAEHPPGGQAEQLHPRRHHGRRPGSGRGAVHLRRARQEDRLHHRRHRDLREGRRRRLRGGLQASAAAPSSSTTAPRRPPRTTSRS